MVQVYFNFNENCSEAIDFYEKALEGKNKKVLRYGDLPANPNFPISDEMKNWVMHGEMIIDGTTFNFSDSQEKKIIGTNIDVALKYNNEEQVKSAYENLVVDGKILIELGKTFFSPMYANVTDKFGITWQLICMKNE